MPRLNERSAAPSSPIPPVSASTTPHHYQHLYSAYLNAYASELLLLPELPLPQGTFQDRLLLAEGRQFGFEFGFPVGGLFARPPDLGGDQLLFLGDKRQGLGPGLLLVLQLCLQRGKFGMGSFQLLLSMEKLGLHLMVFLGIKVGLRRSQM